LTQCALLLVILPCVCPFLLPMCLILPTLPPHTHTHTPQIKGTVLLMPNGSDKVTVAPEQTVSSEHKVEDPELLTLLASSLKPRKPNKKKAAAAASKEA
jgi:hypothetical protein